MSLLPFSPFLGNSSSQTSYRWIKQKWLKLRLNDDASKNVTRNWTSSFFSQAELSFIQLLPSALAIKMIICQLIIIWNGSYIRSVGTAEMKLAFDIKKKKNLIFLIDWESLIGSRKTNEEKSRKKKMEKSDIDWYDIHTVGHSVYLSKL